MNRCFFSLFNVPIWNDKTERLMAVAHRNNWSQKQMKIAHTQKIDGQTVIATTNELKLQLNNIYEWPAIGRWRRWKNKWEHEEEEGEFF